MSLRMKEKLSGEELLYLACVLSFIFVYQIHQKESETHKHLLHVSTDDGTNCVQE